MLDGHSLVYIFHILIVAPLLFYIGYMKERVPNQVYVILMAVAVTIALYHSYKLAIIIMKEKPIIKII
jgi:hypothetical protein